MLKVLQLKIILKGSRPRIWRRFLIDSSITFHQLNSIIQRVMGWENCHLYEFKADGLSILEPHEDYSHEVINSKKTIIRDILTAEKQKFKYIYDFGDYWEHSIVVEKILENDFFQLPACIAGKMACPPEDCGGLWGYAELLEIKKDKNHPEYDERIINWLGEDFDPEAFDIDEINRSLQNQGAR